VATRSIFVTRRFPISLDGQRDTARSQNALNLSPSACAARRYLIDAMLTTASELPSRNGGAVALLDARGSA
jgi:hypothetical protein